MKFKLFKKGNITSKFASPAYTKEVGSVHNGVDWSRGFGSLVSTDNIGIVYKIIPPGYRPDNWTAVYLLCPNGGDGNFVEVVMGHLSTIYPIEGALVKEDAVIGKEGNFGLIYFGGQRITPQMQRAGDKRGAHVHEGYRPVKRVKSTRAGKHYLRTRDEELYRDDQGYVYEIIYDNPTKGWIDPFLFVERRPSDGMTEAIRLRPDLNEKGILTKFRKLLRKFAL